MALNTAFIQPPAATGRHVNEIAIPAPRSRRPLLWAAAALPVIGWGALAMGVATPMKSVIERRASAALDRTVTIGGPVRVMLTPFSVTIDAAQVRVANPRWAKNDALLSVGRVRAKIPTFDLLLGKPGIRALSLRDGTLDLERSADGKANNWSGGKAGSLFDFAAVSQFDADGLVLRYRDPATRSFARLSLADGGRGIVDLTGGGSLGGEGFALTGTSRSSRNGPTRLDLDARTQQLALQIEGTADAPFRLSGARLSARAQGEDFAQLAAIGGIDLPALPAFSIGARIDPVRGGWRFSRIEGKIGATDLSGTLTLVERRGRPLIAAKLASQTLDIVDAAALVGLDGPQDNDLTGARLLPDARFSGEALGRFDAAIDYRADKLAGVPHASGQLSMKLALARGMLRVSPASVDLAGGFVSTDISIDARQSPVLTRADIRLSPTPMGRLLANWGIAPTGTTAMVKARIELTGRGDTLREAMGNANGRIALIMPAGDVRTQQASGSSLDMANLGAAIFRTDDHASPLSTGLNCGLVAFTVENGLGTADPILIDTDGSVLSGTGRFDLRGERLDLRLKAESKSAGWFGRPSPVLIGGTLADPIVEREPVPLFRPASFLGFKLMMPDFGNIFGFVDPEEADAPACGPVLSGSKAAAQRDRGDSQMRGKEFAALR